MSLTVASRVLSAASRTFPRSPRACFPRAPLATIAWAVPDETTSSAEWGAAKVGNGPKAAAAASPSARVHHAVVSIAGVEQPGIVSAASAAMAARGANVEESRMAVLGGDFAMIVYVSLPSAAATAGLAAALEERLPSEFSVSVRETTATPRATAASAAAATAASTDTDVAGVAAMGTATKANAERSHWALSLEGPDSPGIVAAVTEALAVNGCNVHELETETTTAPFAGYELFRLRGVVAVDEAQLDGLAAALEKVEGKFGSTIELRQQA